MSLHLCIRSSWSEFDSRTIAYSHLIYRYFDASMKNHQTHSNWNNGRIEEFDIFSVYFRRWVHFSIQILWVEWCWGRKIEFAWLTKSVLSTSTAGRSFPCRPSYWEFERPKERVRWSKNDRIKNVRARVMKQDEKIPSARGLSGA